VVCRALRSAGYVILEAGDGQTALSVSAQFDGPIHLVVSDAIMPGMAGPEVVALLMRARPDLRAVFMSGYHDNEILSRGLDAGRVVLLQKPFAAAELLAVVRAQLDVPAPDAPVQHVKDITQALITNAARLDALRETNLIDAARDERFDRVTRLAALVLKSPLAFITLVDEHRDFYASAFGLPEPLASVRELKGKTLCQLAIQSDVPLVIDDTSLDPRCLAIPAVSTYGVAAYMGIPLRRNGHAIGSLCVADGVKRSWSVADVQALSDLAGMLMDLIDLHAAPREHAATRLALRKANDQLFLARSTAETAARAQGAFLERMSHEFRTPLNSIIGFTNVIGRNTAGTLSVKDLAYLERVRTNGAQLLDLVDKILSLSKIEGGELQVHYSWVKVDELVRAVQADHASAAAAAGITLVMQRAEDGANCEALKPVHTDANKLRQVLGNLVDNAIKFTAAGGQVRVSIECEPSSGVPRRIDVRDTGVGIAADAQARVFEAFEQAEGDTGARFGGAGVGLRIARALSESLGFALTLESTVGAGSMFSIDFSPSVTA
jgi:signal transduction histidine kinase/CheY-like chemotaxis protein